MSVRAKPGHAALRKGRVSLAHGIYLATIATLNRVRFFLDFAAGCVASRCFEDVAVLRDAKMLAWMQMPDYVHWLIRLGEGNSLSSVVNRLKSASARSINRVLGRTGALWMPAFHDHALRGDEDLQSVTRYLVGNPLRAGLVENIGEYPFWNAEWT